MRCGYDILRGCGRAVLFLGVAIWAAVSLLVLSRHRRDALARAHWLKIICGRVLRVLGVRVIASGSAEAGVLIVPNHLGYLDILVMASLTPLVFVAKKEVRSWPVFGWFAARAGTQFIDRGRRGDVVRVGEELTPLIESGLSVVVFLEGTSSDGRGVLPFKASLLEPAVRQGWRVMPAGISYGVPSGRSAELEIAWWGDMTLPPHLVNLFTLQWVEARVRWGTAQAASGDRKELATTLREEVVVLRNAVAGIESPVPTSSLS